MAEVKIAIYKTPAQVKKTTIYDTVTISKDEAIKLRNYCNQVEDGRITTLTLIGLASPVIGYKLGASIATWIGTYSGASSLVKSYLKQLGNNVSNVVDTMADNQNVTFTYKYRRSGSNDGAYWLVDMK